ncbi:hypothetical protein DM02DRAFT_715277 [Periconia macrospinosa]|uniref:Haloacid dehalogenase n=1 Tax=Periconia macrospinosa TaxID=97972 RepID=A0A2V1E6C3_9PLEO|nr:hypothetical protein DM02DRAFT_715277 [Periconia macrospinosa]
MLPTRQLSSKNNLLLAFDAFGTLFEPNLPIPQAYGRAALRHGITFVDKPEHELVPKDYQPVKESFSRAFKFESARNPNYGNATGLGAEKWWANVIQGTFKPFLKSSQNVPDTLISELLTRYSTKEGYNLFPDVLPLFRMLQRRRATQNHSDSSWKWDRTVVGIITNSDDRVPSVLESFGLKIGARRVGSPAQRTAEARMDDDISFVVLSYDVGNEKPDRRIFEAAEGMLKETLAEGGTDAESQSIDGYEKLYVGDSFDKDYQGAKAAGWDALLLQREAGREQTPRLTKVDAAELTEGKSDGTRVDACTSLEALQFWVPKVQ